MRLIDADALMEKLTSLQKKRKSNQGMDIDAFACVAAINAMPTAFKWHDPDEELPKKSGLYICLSPINNPYEKHWRVDLYRWNKGHFWWHDSEYGEGIVTGMYWWAEMPPMPKMEDEDAAD